MSTLTSDRYVKWLGNGGPAGYNSGPAGNDTFWANSLVMQGTDDGLIKVASGSASGNVVGLYNGPGGLVTSPTAPPPLPFIQWFYGTADFKSDGSVASTTAIGSTLYFSDNQTVSVHTGTYSQKVGNLVAYDASLEFPVFVQFGPLG